MVKKPNGGLRICTDYRALNELTVKNRFPIPLIKDLIDKVKGKKFLTKLDIIAAFNQIRVV